MKEPEMLSDKEFDAVKKFLTDEEQYVFAKNKDDNLVSYPAIKFLPEVAAFIEIPREHERVRAAASQAMIDVYKLQLAYLACDKAQKASELDPKSAKLIADSAKTLRSAGAFLKFCLTLMEDNAAPEEVVGDIAEVERNIRIYTRAFEKKTGITSSNLPSR